jgi:hypothetical protein
MPPLWNAGRLEYKTWSRFWIFWKMLGKRQKIIGVGGNWKSTEQKRAFSFPMSKDLQMLR